MATGFQVVMDCADPDRLATFWASALGYKLQDPPQGYATWEEFLTAIGVPRDEWNNASAVVDSDWVTGSRSPALPTPYPELNGVLRDLVNSMREALGPDFVGAYLQGSFAVGDFDEHSDCDFIVATEGELTDDQVNALQMMHG